MKSTCTLGYVSYSVHIDQGLYKIDYLILGTLSSFFILLNTKVVFYLYLRT